MNLKITNTTNHIVLSELIFCLPDKHCIQKCIFLLHMTIEIEKNQDMTLLFLSYWVFFPFQLILCV